jgi:L-amino acid N-acyltransferase YncA
MAVPTLLRDADADRDAAACAAIYAPFVTGTGVSFEQEPRDDGAFAERIARQGLTLALAGIALPNDTSVALHEALGFEPVASTVASVQGRGVARRRWWQRPLVPSGPEPVDPGAPPRLGA